MVEREVKISVTISPEELAKEFVVSEKRSSVPKVNSDNVFILTPYYP